VSASVPQPLTLRAGDGRELGALLIEATTPRAALCLNGATGFKREFYLKFASYCATRGYHTLLYDYRGVGSSRAGPLPAERACMSDWGRLDLPAAFAALAARYPRLPLATLGHSVGGQLLGCLPAPERAVAHLMIATSTGYWRRQSVPFRYAALLLWQLYGPLCLRRFGYVPRGLLWRGEPLPPGVFRQWRRWCLSAAPYGSRLDAALADAGFAAVRAPILSLGFSDDPIATPVAIAALLVSYPNAPVERRQIAPGAIGARHIGHHGFFLEAHRDTLWRAALDWLDQRTR
jgi:predicted alpha/beta hydrolase